MKANALLLAAALLLAGSVLAMGNKAQGKSGPTVIGSEAPRFVLEDQFGKKIGLKSFGSKAVVLDFWAAWCIPCLKAVPALNRLNEEHGKKLAVVGVSIDKRGRGVAMDAVKRFDMRYRVVQGDDKLADAYRVEAMPYLVVVKDGKIVKTLVGAHSYKALVNELGPWLK